MVLNKKILIGALLASMLAVVYLGATHHWAGVARSVAAASDKSERKVLFWYDAMEPSHHYNKPGKAPDGMDLVPMYETQSPASGGQPGAPAQPAKGERKVLY